MCMTLLTMFSFFFFFLERENREIFIYFRRIHRCRVGGEAMKFENRWTRNDGHIYDLCVSLGGELDGPVIVPTGHHTTWLFTVHSCTPCVTRYSNVFTWHFEETSE